MSECEDYALEGDIKNIKIRLSELINTSTRVDKIGDLLRAAFYSKVNILLKNKKISSAENMIYSYIDIFGIDVEIRNIMKWFERENSKKLAITQNETKRVLREDWLKAL